GQHILVHGGAGGVGSIVVQLAARLGAKVSVTASRRDLAFVTDLGASTVIDYENERFEDRVKDVDAVIDLVGGSTLERSWAVLKPGGVLVGVAEPPAPDVALAHHARAAFFVVEPRRDELLRLARAVDDGRLRPVVDRVLPLHDTRSAYELLGTRHRRGKVVIAVTPERPTVNH
ncbi:MAG TPA: NADP-dependent oxidoreductase, partial [Actinopolymorphaceae bacterium]